MDWITDEILIGNRIVAHDREKIAAFGLRSILSLDGSMMKKPATLFGVESLIAIKLIDGEGNDPRHLELSIQYLERLLDQHSPVLVHCHAGRSRSAAVVAATLAKAQGLKFWVGLRQVEAKREVNVAVALGDDFERICARYES
jgi:protein tyrosine phosphatase (PTP) superfamily phosphohydrolase (DUF442 family)